MDFLGASSRGLGGVWFGWRQFGRCGILAANMRLKNGLHLAYCTNIHRGESWDETFAALKQHTLAVRDRVAGGRPYAIGLRLSAVAARELSDPARLTE